MDNRDKSIDIAKAIGILLMIVGHFGDLHCLIRNAIFSFHMPLFFIFSGYFYKTKAMREVIVNGVEHLVKPYFITAFFCILLCVAVGDWDMVKFRIIGTVMSNGGAAKALIGAKLPYIGPIWFLLALFWCKIFYDFLKKRTNQCMLWSFLISTAAFIIGKYVVNLPLGILTGFCGMVFYCMGDYWKNKLSRPLPSYLLISGILIWGLCAWKSHLEIAAFDCNHYPISMFAAFIGTYVTYLVAGKVPTLFQPFLVWVGQNTLLILCYHTLSFFIMINVKHYLLEPNNIAITNLLNDVFILILSLALPYLHVTIQQGILKRQAIG